MCDPPRIYPSLLEYTPPFSTTIILCDPSRIDPSLPEYTPPFSTTIILCDPPRIYPSLPEYTPLFNNYMRPSQNLPLPPRIYPPFNKCICATLLEYTPFSTTICDPPRIYPSLSEYTPLFNKCIYVRPSQNIPDIYAIFQEYTPQSLNMPPFLGAFVIIRESTTCSQN